MKDCNCGYCVGGEPLAKFGIKICDLEVSQLILLQVYGENIEGPRNLHLGDSPDSVMARFERAYTDGALLYGDGENAPYGKYQVRDDGSIYILYAAQAEDETVLLALTFVNDELVDMTCTYL